MSCVCTYEHDDDVSLFPLSSSVVRHRTYFRLRGWVVHYFAEYIPTTTTRTSTNSKEHHLEMNQRDRSAIVFAAITSIFLFGLKFNHDYLNEYELAYNRQTSPITGAVAGYDPPIVPQLVLDLLEYGSKKEIQIPLLYDNLLDTSDLINRTLEDDKCIPFFWHVYRSAGETMKQLMGECLGLTLASSFTYPIDNMMNQEQVRIMRFNNVKYFNVNLQSQSGVERAKRLDIIHEVQTDLGTMVVDSIISPNINAVLNTLMSENDIEKYATRTKGGLFFMSRNPVEREISNFYAIKSTTQRPDVAAYKISDWFLSPSYLDNVMVRQLTNKMTNAVDLTMDDLFVAIEILRRKCVIGLLEQKQESWNRFQQTFESRWKLKERDTNEICHDKLLHWGWRNRNSNAPSIDISLSIEDEERREAENIIDRNAYHQIAAQNQLDMLLYEYTKYLFWEQRGLFYKDVVATVADNLNPENTTDTDSGSEGSIENNTDTSDESLRTD